MVTFYANIRIKGGSRPLCLRPMGERGSAPEPSVIRIFAYPGYKGAYTGGFNALRSSFLSVSGGLCELAPRFCQSVCVELVDGELVELGELVDVELVELGELVDGSATLGDACREVAPFLFPWGFE